MFVYVLTQLFSGTSVTAPVEPVESKTVEELPAAIDCNNPINAGSPACASREFALELIQRNDALSQQLQSQKASAWAGTGFAEGSEAFEQGKEAFHLGQFDRSVPLLKQANDQLSAVLSAAPAIAQALLADGWGYLEEGRAKAAGEAFDKVLAIEPGNQSANQGLNRALVFEEVSMLVLAGDEALTAGQPKEALALYRKAQTLDAVDARVVAGLVKADQAVAAARLAEALRQGYADLAAGKYQPAIKAFDAALRVDPGSNAAKQGRAQARDGLEQQRFEALRKSAVNAAEQYRWRDVVQHATGALNIDPDAQTLRALLQRADSILQADSALDKALAQPMRLAYPAAAQEARQLLGLRDQLQDPGPQVLGKFDQLEQLTLAMAKPLSLVISSDGKTEVRVDGGVKLGKIDNIRIELKPGNYVFRGFRPGYREVRKEVLVVPGMATNIVTVVCDEPIP